MADLQGELKSLVSSSVSTVCVYHVSLCGVQGIEGVCAAARALSSRAEDYTNDVSQSANRVHTHAFTSHAILLPLRLVWSRCGLLKPSSMQRPISRCAKEIAGYRRVCVCVMLMQPLFLQLIQSVDPSTLRLTRCDTAV